MARSNRTEKLGADAGAMAAIRPSALALEFFERLREGLIGGMIKPGGGEGPDVYHLGRRPDAPQGGFREVFLTGAPPYAARGVCVVLPGGLRIEGLDVQGAAALAKFLR